MVLSGTLLALCNGYATTLGCHLSLKNTCLHYDCPNIVLHASRSVQDRLSPWLAATSAQRPAQAKAVSPSNLKREVLQEVMGGEGPSPLPSLVFFFFFKSLLRNLRNIVPMLSHTDYMIYVVMKDKPGKSNHTAPRNHVGGKGKAC